MKKNEEILLIRESVTGTRIDVCSDILVLTMRQELQVEESRTSEEIILKLSGQPLTNSVKMY